MRKQNSFKRNGLGLVAATSLSLSLALFGCTTNQNPGNGEPERRPTVGPTSPSSTPGSSSGTSVVPPSMTSAAPASPVSRSEDAAATMAALAGYRGRDLGPVDPGPSTAARSASPADIPGAYNGQVIPPALIANPQITVNSSISSGPTPVVSSGAGGGAATGAALIANAASSVAATPTTAAVAAAPTTAAITATPTATSATVPSTTAATAAGAVITTPTTALTPANAATTASAGQFASGVTPSTGTTVDAGTLTPTVASALTATPTAAANPAVTSTTSSTTAASTSTSRAATNTANGSVGVTSGIRGVRQGTPNFSAMTAAAQTGNVTSAPSNTVTVNGRSRAIRTVSGSSSASATSARVARPVRISTTSNGNVVVTNVP